ncbi:MAG: alcohol dehydrogenase, partial [Candidatus Hydrogenedentes bacterium]|nr:alcohol dehydrogenase [Candidatus Hydrogenedentota bacterium]
HSKQVTCVGKHRWKLELLERQQIATALDTDGVEPGADIVVEATGSATGLQRAFELVRPQGTVVLKTTAADAARVNMALPVINEVTVLGSRCGPFRPALEALALGTIDVQHLVSEVYPLEDGVKALERATDSHVMKVLIKM